MLGRLAKVLLKDVAYFSTTAHKNKADFCG